jgi:vacuolar protein sorting-associated protein 13A/C
VVLRNLRLRPDALASLALPLVVRAGLCGSLTMKLPWSKLGSAPVVLSLDRVYLLATPSAAAALPRTPEEQARASAALRASNSRVRAHARAHAHAHALTRCLPCPPSRRQAALVARATAALRARLARAEREWLRGRGGGGASASASASASAWLRSYAATIVGNVRLSVTNVHIRFEDGGGFGSSGVPHPLAAGVTLASLRAITVDADGAETFATAGALERVRKARALLRSALLRRVCFALRLGSFWARCAPPWPVPPRFCAVR